MKGMRVFGGAGTGSSGRRAAYGSAIVRGRQLYVRLAAGVAIASSLAVAAMPLAISVAASGCEPKKPPMTPDNPDSEFDAGIDLPESTAPAPPAASK